MKRIAWLSLIGLFGVSCGPPTTTDACQGRQEGDLVITEIMADPEGTDTGGEWFEVYNTLGTTLTLPGLTLYVRDTDGSGAKSHTIRAGSIPARSYFVFGDIRSGANPAWINYAYGDALGSMGNSRGVVGVRCGQTTLAEATYTRAARAERSRMLDGVGDPITSVAAVEANWCDTPPGTIYFGNNAGTPGSANPRCVPEAMAGTCVDNGTVRAMTAPQAGDLVITEVLARPAASSGTTGEWFEVLARADVDLNDVTLYTTTSDTKIESGDCLRVTAGEYVLLARSADTFVNGELPPPKATYSSVSFADTTNQRVGLARGDAGIDEVALFGSASGRAWQLDPLKLDPASNDDPNNFCRAPNRWGSDGGGDYGSPGQPNPECPIVDAGMTDPDNCFDTGLQAMRPVVWAEPGQLVVTEWMADPNSPITDTNGEWFEVMATANVDLNGVALQVGTSRTTLSSANCLPTTANSFLVFGKSTDPGLNGNLPTLTASFTGTLANTSGAITVLTADGGASSAITYTGSTAGASRQVDLADGGVCDTPTQYRYGPLLPDGGASGDRGTPGLVNVSCP